MKQRVDEGAPIVGVLGGAGSRVHHHARWLVDDDEIVVFIHDIERNFFCDGAGELVAGLLP